MDDSPSVRFLLPRTFGDAEVPRTDSMHFVASSGIDFPVKAKIGRGLVWDKERLDLLGVVVSRENMKLDGLLNVKESDLDKQLQQSINKPIILFGADRIHRNQRVENRNRIRRCTYFGSVGGSRMAPQEYEQDPQFPPIFSAP